MFRSSAKKYSRNEDKYKNQKNVIRDGLHYQGNDHQEAIEQLFEINKIVPNMCEGRSKFNAKEFRHNIIIAMLHEKARFEFIKRNGRNLHDKNDVLAGPPRGNTRKN